MMRQALSAAGLLALLTLPAGAQDNKRKGPDGPLQFPPFKVDQVKVDAAIRKGVAFLKTGNAGHKNRFEHAGRTMQHTELVLLTYVHAGMPESDPAFEDLFKDMTERKLEATYCVALQAMILEEVERVKFQKRIAMCAQFLVDNQCTNGQWTYGSPSIYVEDVDVPTTAPRKDVESAGGRARKYDDLPPPGVKVKPKVVRKVTTIKKMKDGGGSGDNSNTQYAALGMRACHDSGIVIPKEVTELAMKWYRDSQKDIDPNDKPERLDLKDLRELLMGDRAKGQSAVMNNISATPEAWCYGPRDHNGHKPYGSMTAGSTGGICIWDYIRDNDEGRAKSWKKDKDVHEGLQWMAKNFSVTYNPGPYEHGGMAENSQHQYYYYLYALERVGMLYGTETVGSHEWYPEGAKVLIESQKGDGSWGNVVDTCFAILFLKRATRPLDVATTAAGGR